MSESGLYSEESESDDSLGYQDDKDTSYDYTGEDEDSDTDQEEDEFNEYSESEEGLESEPLPGVEDGWQHCERGEERAQPLPQVLVQSRGPAFWDMFFLGITFVTALIVGFYYIM
eukprot:GFUD01102577.1.p1 GENE.GFUD01102577.1~~GFUD01102577.1.p1  ORF type:complete len:115 (-),score=30.68 GFUD01102577.1:8-352(-)